MIRWPIVLLTTAALLLWLASALQPALQTRAMQSRITTLEAELAQADQGCHSAPVAGGAL
tara:strand:+ start:191 stop:370 length:180 start_codon:yes stop_codon:yes gene_type:complete